MEVLIQESTPFLSFAPENPLNRFGTYKQMKGETILCTVPHYTGKYHLWMSLVLAM